MIIAIDGPAGVGKSSTSRLIAQILGVRYLNTGTIYRAVSLLILYNKIDIRDIALIRKIVSKITTNTFFNPTKEPIFSFNENVNSLIKNSYITRLASRVSTIPNIRKILIKQQRNLISSKKTIIVEGRDIGTIVFPKAEIKIFLTASDKKRAQRRNIQNISNGLIDNYDKVLQDIRYRDYLDLTRSLSPMLIAKDALVVNTSWINKDQAVAFLIEKIIKITRIKL